jgi:hypothetical protein
LAAEAALIINRSEHNNNNIIWGRFNDVFAFIMIQSACTRNYVK